MWLLRKWFGSKEDDASKEIAKKRLQLLLIHDQINLTPNQLQQMKSEIIEVIERYINIDTDDTHVLLDRLDNQIKLVSSVPIQQKRRMAH